MQLRRSVQDEIETVKCHGKDGAILSVDTHNRFLFESP